MVCPSGVEARSLPRAQIRNPNYSAVQTATLNIIDSASHSPTCRPVTTVDTKSLSLALLHGVGYTTADGGPGNFMTHTLVQFLCYFRSVCMSITAFNIFSLSGQY
jgi:hypothetical protein